MVIEPRRTSPNYAKLELIRTLCICAEPFIHAGRRTRSAIATLLNSEFTRRVVDKNGSRTKAAFRMQGNTIFNDDD